jgi:hypothetical protein
MVASKSLGFSIPRIQNIYLEEKIGYDIIDVIMALLAETMQDKRLQNKITARIESFNSNRC